MLDLVYPILDREVNEKRDLNPLALCKMWIANGVYAFQVRDKLATYTEYIHFCKHIKQNLPEARLISNDFVPIDDDKFLFVFVLSTYLL